MGKTPSLSEVLPLCVLEEKYPSGRILHLIQHRNTLFPSVFPMCNQVMMQTISDHMLPQ